MPTDTTTQANALAHGVGVRVREDLVEVEISGDDARSWLNGQVTNDVRQTRPGQGIYALVVSVKGKVMADAWVLDRGEALSLLLPKGTEEEILARFDGQIIMEDVELEVLGDQRVVALVGPAAEARLDALGLRADAFEGDELGTGGYFLRCAAAEAEALVARVVDADVEGRPAAAVDESGVELARLRVGRPRFGRDFDLRHYPQEAGLKARAVSFQKGCYLGQEVVCTLESRGKLSRRLYRLSARTAPTATDITGEGGAVVGELTSGADDPETGGWIGLGYLRRAGEADDAELRAGEVTLSRGEVAG